MTSVCAWCQKERQLTILDGTALDQALQDINDDNLTHGICGHHAAEALYAYLKPKEKRDAK